jgi:hypothetical protein
VEDTSERDMQIDRERERGGRGRGKLILADRALNSG